MPKESNFVGLFVDHSALIVQAADSLAAMMSSSEEALRAKHGNDIRTAESRADIVTHNTVVALHRAFMTPFHRSDIHALSKALDDAIDLIEEVVLGAELYRVTEFDAHMRKMTSMIQETATLVAELMPLLHNISGNAERINALCEQISRIEGQSDDALREAIAELVAERPDTITFFGRKEMYELLEAVTDSCDDVGDIIVGIVLDQV